MIRVLPGRRAAFAAILASGALTVGFSSAAFAAGPPTGGTPGTPNCFGQTVAGNNLSGFGGKDHVGVGEVVQMIDVPFVTVPFLIDMTKAGCQ
jgi:hypothetical protein